MERYTDKMLRIKFTVEALVEKMFDVSLLFYLCILSGNKTGEGLDAFLVRISLIVVTLLGAIYILRNYYKISYNKKILAWLYTFWIYAFLSFLWAKSLEDSLQYLNHYVSILLVGTFLCFRVNSIRDVEKILHMFLFAGLYSVVILIIRVPESAYGTSTFGDYIGVFKNTLSARMVILSIIAMYFGKNKKLYYLLLPAFLFVIINANSRTGIILLVLAFLLYPITSGNLKKTINNVVLIVISVLMLLLICVSTGVLEQLANGPLENLFAVINKGVGNNSDDAYRLVLINGGLKMFYGHPFLGVGINNFKTYINMYGLPYVVRAHNDYIELLSTLGIIGFLMYYIRQFRAMQTSYRLRTIKIQQMVFIIWVIATFDGIVSILYADVYSQLLYILLCSSTLISKCDKVNDEQE